MQTPKKTQEKGGAEPKKYEFIPFGVSGLTGSSLRAKKFQQVGGEEKKPNTQKQTKPTKTRSNTRKPGQTLENQVKHPKQPNTRKQNSQNLYIF